MGRPPIGKQAMSGSERQRRYLERLLRGAKSSTAPAPDRAIVEELARAKAQIADLTRELTRHERQPAGHNAVSRPSAPCAACAEKDRVIERLTKQLAAAQKPPTTPTEQVAKLEKQLKAAQTRNHNLTMEKQAAWKARDKAEIVVRHSKEIIKKHGRKVRSALHPDKVSNVAAERREWLTEASQTINALWDEFERQINRVGP